MSTIENVVRRHSDIDGMTGCRYSTAMDVEFEEENLRRLAFDVSFDMGFERGVVKAFRMRIQYIDAAPDERSFATLNGWRFEKLKGDLAGKHSIRLNKQWRLIVRIDKRENGKTVVVISICDYH